nr:hypothetical protein [Tanacetum cinerariifolium]
DSSIDTFLDHSTNDSLSQRFNELALMCPIMVEPKREKVDAYIQGLTDNIKGEVTSSKPANLNKAQGNARAMVTAPTDGKVSSGSLPLYERCFTRHVGLCTIKCHNCGKVGHKARYYKEKNVATGATAQPIPTCYDCGEQCYTRNRCPKKVKQEEVGEVRGRAYAIKDAEPQGPNVVTGTFLLNNYYASILFKSSFDRSSMLNIDPVKIRASYEILRHYRLVLPPPPPLSMPSAKLMIMALEEYWYQSRRGIHVPKKWNSSYFGDVILKKGDEGFRDE